MRKDDDAEIIRLADQEIVRKIARDVIHMADREAMVAELKARLKAGRYRIGGEDIAEAMIRRAIAESFSS